MKIITIYHGSEKIIKNPELGLGNPNNDYGLGFYCTENIELAKEWANRNVESGYVNQYELDLKYLKVLDLTNKEKYNVLNWLSILLTNRLIGERYKTLYKDELKFINNFSIDISTYDVVIGY